MTLLNTSVLKTTTAAFALVLLAACSSTGSDTVAVAQNDAAASNGVSADNPEGLICKRVAVTGTRFTENRCTTAAQREEMARNAKMGTDKLTIRAKQAGGPSGG